MNPPGFRYNEAASNAAILPSLPSEPADRLYWLEGQLFVAMPFSRYQALMGSPSPDASHSPLTSHTTWGTAVQSSTAFTAAQGSLATTPAPSASSSMSPIEPHTALDNARVRTRVPVACANCHYMRKSCDAERPCQRCVRRGLSACCVDHTRAARRSFPGQSKSDSASATSSAGGATVPFLGNEGAGGSGGQNPPLFPPPNFSFLLPEYTAPAAATSNVDININALWGLH